jgi:hypothetical protein
MIADNPPGPQHGPQPDAIYCPLCTAHLRARESRQYPPDEAHRYECEHGHFWEINRLPEQEVNRTWNGARPNWGNGPA